MKKAIIMLLALGLIFFGIAPSTMAAQFTDVTEDHRFYEEISYLAEREIVSGFKDGKFDPDSPVSRAEAAVMIGRYFDVDGTPADTKFWDVVERTFGSGYINEMEKRGIIIGYPGDLYRPHSAVTRIQMAIYIARTFDLKEEVETVDFVDAKPHYKGFSDLKKVLAAGIVSGYPDNTYRFEKGISRAEFSAMLARGMDDRFKVGVE